jgi:hypothetical protein
MIRISAQRRPHRVAVGVSSPKRPHAIQAVVSFDEETFRAIRERAIAGHVSFAQQVRELVEWGMESADGS